MEGYVKVYRMCITWREKGGFHRTAGPAAVWENGAKEWYINGESLTKKAFNRWRKAWKGI